MADYVLPIIRTKFGERGFCFSGPAAWNSLPSSCSLTDVTDIAVFKNGLSLYFSIAHMNDFCTAFLHVT